jgi:UDP-N-acetylmuramoyl-L-alanyl-D-glutamate--2,6-diaminopimelate ligase
MLLSEAFRAAGSDAPAPPVPVTGVACDTRKVVPGNIFVAISGHKLDGHAFVPDAISRGAVAAVVERPVDVRIPLLVVPDARLALARLADALHGRPSERVRVAGITGTKGKTTTTFLYRSIVQAAGKECGLLGTIAYEAFGRSRPSDNTTPDPCEVQAFLASLDAPGAGHAVMEVSSHALVQRRVAGVRFAAAAFTNLSGEHLDYHKTMDAYRDAKGLLFEALAPDAVAVLNAAQPASAHYASRTAARVLRYGFIGNSERLDVAADEVRLAPSGTRFRLHLPGEPPHGISLALVGRHNVENALAAAALAHALGFPAAAIVRGLESVALVPGRLEPVDEGQPFRVLVDYAHTDDALEKVLTSLRAVSDGRIVCVFGCGGDRDRTKRPRMARVAERLADEVVITSDNPRSEEPAAIIDEIVRGLERPDRAVVEPERHDAIRRAIDLARAGDIVLVAGKGHETYQILRDRTIHFDDREVAREHLRRAAEGGAPWSRSSSIPSSAR